ncbi:transglycosylase family protein [Streptomyces xanthii]|uniref:Transglycosylase family protein n=1 Tax=Streptomyces xanthii TaxID=2768069 RepID=A0A7H1BJL2_9ACTN|nr:transglycosylase family protein [Streptomyces xanthii]
MLAGAVGTAVFAGTGSASAAPAASGWDAVAQCESTGNWSANTGNGFSGGLQFTPSTWAAYGGTQYAPAAHQASKSEQIAVANKVLASQGKGAWPVCGAKL